MKEYTVSIDIDVPRDRVVELFVDPQNMFHWQNGLQSFEHVSGEPGQQGAISRMIYHNGNRHIELQEEITSNNLPDEFSGIYSWGGGSNTLVNHFIEIDATRTRWESTCCYRMKSVSSRIINEAWASKWRRLVSLGYRSGCVVSTVHPRPEIDEFKKLAVTSGKSPQRANQTPVVVNHSG